VVRGVDEAQQRLADQRVRARGAEEARAGLVDEHDPPLAVQQERLGRQLHDHAVAVVRRGRDSVPRVAVA
jgi:hypothetical protein